jgi:hypothetical protein
VRDALDLVLCLLFAAGSFYYYLAGVVDENRALSRSASGFCREGGVE